MVWLRIFVHRLRGIFLKRRRERELEDEIRSHLEMQVEENLHQGMSQEEARLAARRKFGGVEQIKEIYRDRSSLPLLESTFQDLRYAARMFARSPGFSLVAVTTLALGIGANTAIFSVANAVLLRPLAYQDSDRLVQINHHYKKSNGASDVSAVGYVHYRDNSKSFESIGACAQWSVNLTGTDDPERLSGVAVTPTFFPTFGVNAARGRVFTADDDKPGRNHVVVLSDSLWQRRFAADRDIIGKAISLSGNAYTVVGVLPPGYQFGREFGQTFEIYSPITFTPEQMAANWLYESLAMFARLKPNVTLQQAQAELNTIAANVPADIDKSLWGLLVRPLQDVIVGPEIRRSLLILMAAVGFVLLIACANAANLQLARASVRQREIGIRLALGAGRLRIVRQLLTESVLLALIGGALGLLLANWGMQSLLSFNERLIPRAHEIGIDWRVLAFTLGISLLTGLLFGLAPALRSSRTDIHETLKEAGRSGVAQASGWLRSGLLVFEVTSTLVLLIGAGLLIKSFWLVQEVNPGFNPNNLLALEVSLPNAKYKEPARIDNFFQSVLGEISSLPGVKLAGLSSTLPMSSSNRTGCSFVIEGKAPKPGEDGPWGDLWYAGANYFQTMNIPLIRGRYFDDRDVLNAPFVAIIDETMARKWWPNDDPIGKRIWVYENDSQGNKRWREIIGIVGHVKRHSLDRESSVQYYLPHRQTLTQNVILTVRTAAEQPENMTAAIRGIIRSADNELPVYKVATMERMMAESTSQRRFSTILLGVFALVALILASVGLFGVMSYSVAQRTHEIGIRMALGAQPLDVVKIIIRQGMTSVSLGLAFGLAASIGLTRLMKSLLYGISPTDTTIFSFIPLLLAVVALLACYLPAKRATKVDPLIALRSE
jgi:putative ABC transport system permease protein